MQVDRNYLNASSDNKGVLQDYVKDALISDACYNASLMSHSNNKNLKSKEKSGVNINVSNNVSNNVLANTKNPSNIAYIANNNGVYLKKNATHINDKFDTLNVINNNYNKGGYYLDKVKKTNIGAMSVPITSKQSKNNSKNNSKSTSRVDEKEENKRSKLFESEIKKFQTNMFLSSGRAMKLSNFLRD